VSASAARRARVLRLRVIAHRLASVRLAVADAAHGAIASIDERVAQLHDGIAMPNGICRGHELQSLCELSQRLERARIGLQPSLDASRATRNARDAERLAARIAEERMSRVHAGAVHREAAAKDLQTASSQPPRWKKGRARP
jgi:hypothetical protein